MKNKINLDKLPKVLCGIGNKPNEYKYSAAINEVLLKTVYYPDAGDIGKTIQSDIDKTNPTHQTHEQLSEHYKLDDYNQIHAVKNYTGGSSVLNNHLFDTKGDHDKINHDNMRGYGFDIQQLDRALDQRAAPKEFFVYSGIPFNPNEVKNTDGLIHLPAYTSTSLKFSKATGFARHFSDHDDPEHTSHHHVLKIHIPEGSKHGGYIDQHSNYKDNEHEFLMKRNSVIKVDRVPETHIASNGINHTKVHVWNAHIVESGIGVDHTNDDNYDTEESRNHREYKKEIAGYKLDRDKLTPEGVHHAMNTLINHGGYSNSASVNGNHVTDISHDSYDGLQDHEKKINKFLDINGFKLSEQNPDKNVFVHETEPVQVEINKNLNMMSFTNYVKSAQLTKQHIVNALAKDNTEHDSKHASGVYGTYTDYNDVYNKTQNIHNKLSSLGFVHTGFSTTQQGVAEHTYTNNAGLHAVTTYTTNPKNEIHGYNTEIINAPKANTDTTAQTAPAKLTKQDVIDELAKDSHKYAHGVTGQHKTHYELVDKVLSINKKLNGMGFSYLGSENNEYGVIHNYTHPDNITAKITHTNRLQKNPGYAVTISDAAQTQNKIEPIRKELTHESLHNIINDIPTSGIKKNSTFNGSTKTIYTTDVYHQSADSVNDHFNKVQSKLKQLGFSENPDSVDDNKLYEHPTKDISVTLVKNHENKWSSVDVWKKK